jgi:hypothetical protein
MVPQPVALGLTLCAQVLVEEGTRNVSLINTFTTWPMKRFPSPPRVFCLFAVLKNGQGDGTIEVAVTQEDTDEIVFSVHKPVHFLDRLAEVRVIVRYNECSFPTPPVGIRPRWRWTATGWLNGGSISSWRETSHERSAAERYPERRRTLPEFL